MHVENSARRTYYVVQSFTRDRQGLRMDAPVEARSEDSALRLAERISHRKASVVVLARTGDPETGEFDEPVVLRSHGESSVDDLPF